MNMYFYVNLSEYYLLLEKKNIWVDKYYFDNVYILIGILVCFVYFKLIKFNKI